MRVLLLSANPLDTPYPVYPVGLDHVAGALIGHDVSMLDIQCLSGLEELGAFVRNHNPDLVGVSLRNIDNADASAPFDCLGHYVAVVNCLRGATTCPLVLGGAGFTIFPRALMELLKPDYGLVGEGERLADLIAAIERGLDPASVPGVLIPGQPASNNPPLPLAAIHPSRNAIDMRVAGHYLERGGMLGLQTKRGCPLRCIYCTYPTIEGREQRTIPPGMVADRAVELQSRGASFLFITDSVFNLNPRHCLQVAQAFADAGVRIPWGGYFTPARMPAGFYRHLVAAGLTHVEFGTESLCDAVLHSYRKPFRYEDILHSHHEAQAAGLHIAHYVLFGGPGETRKTVTSTLRRCERLRHSVLFFMCGMRIYPRTQLYETALAEGQIAADADLLRPVFYRPSAISVQDIAAMVVERARGRPNWVLAGGGGDQERILQTLHRKGLHGPLWEHLIP